MNPGQGVEPRSPRSERGVLPVRRSRNTRASAASGARRSVQERDVPHRTRALFGVHYDPVPAVQCDRRVIGMADRSLCEQLGVADEPRPAAATPVLLGQSAIAGVADPAWMTTVHPDDLAAASIGELDHVRLAAPTRKRLVAKDERGRWVELERRDEEPLALADVGRVAAAEGILRPCTTHRRPDKRRLQRSLRGPDT